MDVKASEEQFKLVAAAYAVLSDDAEKRKFDADLRVHLARDSGRSGYSQPSHAPPFNGFSGGYGSTSAFYSGFHGRRRS